MATANVTILAPQPFPAQVVGNNGIVVSVANGIYTIANSAGAIQSIITTLGIVASHAGTGLLNFGAAPGTSDAQLVITGQSGIIAGSIVDAWIVAVATADHSADEHWADPPAIFAGNIVPGIGFTIYGVQREIGDVLTYGNWTVAWQWQ